MSLQLEQDAQVPIQTHIDEFSSRFAIMIFIWVITSIIWITNIDPILELVLRTLEPCEETCSNLYNPAKWSEIRWLSGALMGFISIIPLIIYQVLIFSRPGMMKKESRWLLTMLILGSLAFIINILLTIFVFMPNLFKIGHESQMNLGFVAKYDVVEMLSMAMAIIWIEILIVSGIVALVSAGITGLMHKDNSGWWRIRVHGIVSMLILLSFYGEFTLSLLLIAISFSLIELISLPWIRAKASMYISSPVIFDEYGITRKVLFAQCECDNEWKLNEELISNVAFTSFKSLCNNKSDKEKLYQIIEINKFTDFVIFGCNNKSLTNQIENNLFTSKCLLRTEISSHNPKQFLDLEHYWINTQYLMASIVDPWSEDQALRKILKLAKKYSDMEIIITTTGKENFNQYQVKQKEVMVEVSKPRKDILVTELESFGYKYRIVES